MTASNATRDGIIAGYLLKLARESTGCTQIEMAHRLAIDPHTLHSWETGRRSLAATNVRDLVQLRLQLFNLGVDPTLIDCLDTALEADYILNEILDYEPSETNLNNHPLTNWLLPHGVSEMLAWPVTSATPSAVMHITPKVARRGPVAPGPALSTPERTQFFRNLSRAADLLLQQQESGDPDRNLLAHQLYFRIGWSNQPDADEWLRTVYAHHLRRFPKFDRWSPQWLERRSLVMAMASRGDPEPIQRFIQTAHGSDEFEMANLNYWAYWAGELRDRQRSQEFMVNSKAFQAWTGTTLIPRLTNKLMASNPNLELNIHSVAVLLTRAITIQVLEGDSDLAAAALAKVARLIDEGVPLSAHARHELDDIHRRLAQLQPTGAPAPRGAVGYES